MRGGAKETLENYILLRNSFIEKIRNGDAAETPCADCPALKKEFYKLNKQPHVLHFSLSRPCNFDCTYCTAGSRNWVKLAKKEQGRLMDISIAKYIKEAKKMLGKLDVVDLVSGEPLIQHDRTEILEAIQESGSKVHVFTNGSFYAQELKQGFAPEDVTITTSIDCGTRKTFHKIRGVDMFDRVRDNLIQYSQDGIRVRMKYILMNRYNNNEIEIDGFFKLCEEVNPVEVHLTRDEWEGEITPGELKAAAMFIDKAKRLGMNILYQDYHFPINRLFRVNGK